MKNLLLALLAAVVITSGIQAAITAPKSEASCTACGGDHEKPERESKN